VLDVGCCYQYQKTLALLTVGFFVGLTVVGLTEGLRVVGEFYVREKIKRANMSAGCRLLVVVLEPAK